MTNDRQTTERTRKGQTRRTTATLTSPKPVPAAWPEIDPDLAARFTEFADACSRFSKEIVERNGAWIAITNEDHARLNMQIARTVFSKWSVDILAFLYTGRVARFHEIKKAIGHISSRILSLKLSRLARLGLVRRVVLDTGPSHVEYSLTEKGLRVAKLGEPVFLYLRLTEGLLVSDPP